MGEVCQRYAPADLPPGKSVGTHRIRNSLGARTGLDGRGISCPYLSSNPETSSPVSSKSYAIWPDTTGHAESISVIKVGYMNGGISCLRQVSDQNNRQDDCKYAKTVQPYDQATYWAWMTRWRNKWTDSYVAWHTDSFVKQINKNR
jgi:hypothetical protein